MREFIELLIHFVTTCFKLLKPGGMKVVMVDPSIRSENEDDETVED